MRIAVIGLGSMGKRRIRLIKEMYPEYEIIGVDGREDRRNEAAEMFHIPCFDFITDIENKVDCAFICTSPLSHVAIISDCLKNGWHVFSELNLVQDGYDENIKLAKEKKCTLFLSSTFFYREELKYISSRITTDKKWNYIYHIVSIFRTGIRGKVIRTFLLVTGERMAAGRLWQLNYRG